MASGGVHAYINTNLESKRKTTDTSRQGKVRQRRNTVTFLSLVLVWVGPSAILSSRAFEEGGEPK